MNLARLRALVWLRARLARNQFARGKTWVHLLGIVLRLLLVAAAVGLVLVGYFLGRRVLADAPTPVLWAAWGGVMALFLFFWMVAVVSEVQRAEALDVRRLMHLPVSLRQLFVLNYVASLCTPALILAAPASCALALGLVLGRGRHLAWLFPVLFAFFFVLTAWTYCLRGWLVNLMVNKRRRRAIVMGLTAGLVLLGQLPNLLFNSPAGRQFIDHHDRWDPGVLKGIAPLAAGIMALPASRLAVPLAAGGILLGALGLHRAYRVTVVFYTAESSPPRVRRRRQTAKASRRLLVERRLPLLPEPVSAMTTAFLRSNLRAPELRMAMIMPVVMIVVFGLMFAGRTPANLDPSLQALPVLGVIALAVFTTSTVMFNAFGFDRDAFRTLLLQPAEGWQILLAKNLAFLPFPIAVGMILLLAVGILLRVSPGTFLAALFQLLAACVFLCVPANYASTRVPFRLSGTSMRRPHLTVQTLLAVFVIQLTIPLVVLVVAIPPAAGILIGLWNPLAGALLAVIGSLLLLVLAVGTYGLVLPVAGRYLHSRSFHILHAVTAEPA